VSASYRPQVTAKKEIRLSGDMNKPNAMGFRCR
jgi:hypothetical protein